MILNIDVSMTYQLGDPMVLLTLEVARTPEQTVIRDEIGIDSATVTRVDGEGGLGTRMWANVAAPQLQLRYQAEVDTHGADTPLEDLAADPMHAMPGAVISYLRPSRFCQSDMFAAFVERQFGHLSGGTKVAAIRDWIAKEFSYIPGTSDAATTALDTFIARAGVCRDYAHMVCALVRAGNIPARFASVYGVGVTPPDFHAVAQVWLDGAWHFVDATGMCEPDALALISAGRDATDVAFMETGAPAQFISQSVTVTRGADGARTADQAS